MSLLKKAENKMAYAKVGLYGTAGSGKTRTACELAIGIHKAIGSKKPIVVFDTEPAFSFVLPLFEKAGIELLICDNSRSLADLMKVLDEAEKISDVIIIDSITHVWRDAQDSYLKKLNVTRKQKGQKPVYALEFHHWKPIKAAWASFTDRFLSSKIHMIVCGRSGGIYEYQEKDDGSGKKELITSGTRMATEKELGYEPSLLIEMVAKQDDGKITNIAMVQKDRSDKLNGHAIPMPTFAKLKPHFDALNLGGAHFDSMDTRDSSELYEIDELGWDKEQQQRTIYAEKITELLKKHHPSQSVEGKQARMDLVERFFNTRSWTEIKNTPSQNLKANFSLLQAHLEPSNEPEGDIPQ